MKFELTKKQIEKKDEWTAAIKVIHGKIGMLEYRFTPTGINNNVTVYSKLTKTELDLTQYDDL